MAVPCLYFIADFLWKWNSHSVKKSCYVVLMMGLASVAPSQWERIKPIGKAPSVRYSHSSVTFTSAQGMVYLFGGFSGTSPMDCDLGCTFYNDVWLFDSPAQGWEEIYFTPPRSVTGLPTERAEHAMTSCGGAALMCGGFTSNVSGGIALLQDANGLIDCWWLTPIPVATWTTSLIQPYQSTGPAPRHGHSLTFDPDKQAVLLFGGCDAASSILDDCWWLNTTQASTEWPPAESAWTPCRSSALVGPSPRFGHGAAVFRGALFIFGGFVSDGHSNAVAQDDMWSLAEYWGDGGWSHVMPASTSPGRRAYFGCWQAGFLLYVSGGEGPTDTLQDTWFFNFYTKVESAPARRSYAFTQGDSRVARVLCRVFLARGGVTV
jgi:hypothetical protein